MILALSLLNAEGLEARRALGFLERPEAGD